MFEAGTGQRLRQWLLACTLLVTFGACFASEPVIAILIDDVGYERANGFRLLKLPRAISISVLPSSPHGAELARLAREQGRDVLLHQPLTPRAQKKIGPGGINVTMTAREMANVLDSNLRWLGGAVGLNNHMGSAFTVNPSAVERLARVVRENHRSLFVVDSRTDKDSVFQDVMATHRLRAVRRNVFLDHEPTAKFVARQIDALVATARRDGTALAIGHPFTVTLAALERRLPKLGVKLVSVSALVKRRMAADAN